MNVTVEYVNGVPRVIVDPEGYTGTVYVINEAGERRTIDDHGGVAFVDPLAPLAGSLKYGKTNGIVAAPPWSVTIPRTVGDAIVVPGGSASARIILQNERQVEFDLGASVVEAVNNPVPWVKYPKMTREPRVRLSFHSFADDTTVIEELLSRGQTLQVKHAPGCRVPRCKIPAERFLLPLSASHDYVGWSNEGELVAWQMECVATRPVAGSVPARTWFLDGDAVDSSKSWKLSEASWFSVQS